MKRTAQDKLDLNLKKRVFSLYTSRRAERPTLSSREFLQDPYFKEHPEDLLSAASVNRIVRQGMAYKWEGFERLSGCCPKHSRIDITQSPCRICQLSEDFADSYRKLADEDPEGAAEVILTGATSPTPGFSGLTAPVPLADINRHRRLAERVLRRLPRNSALKTFIESSLPVEEFPTYTASPDPQPPTPHSQPSTPDPYIYVPTKYENALSPGTTSSPASTPDAPLNADSNFIVHAPRQ